jgi:hypothetical protein
MMVKHRKKISTLLLVLVLMTVCWVPSGIAIPVPPDIVAYSPNSHSMGDDWEDECSGSDRDYWFGVYNYLRVLFTYTLLSP